MSSGILAGRYRLERLLGTGAISEVYEATDQRLGREVAVKLLRPELLDDADLAARFTREARVAAALSHPNIVGVYDVGQDGDQPFLVMELVSGRPLRDYLQSDAPFEPADVVTVLDQLCDALDYAHGRGVVHRSVTPENILITDQGRVKIGDFGIAPEVSADTLARDLGGATYLPPEQARGEAASPAGDVYSAAVIAFEMLTGQPPYTGRQALADATQRRGTAPPAPTSVNRKLPPEIDEALLPALDQDPRRRYASAMDLADSVAGALNIAGSGPPALPPVGPEQPERTVAMPVVRARGAAPIAAAGAAAMTRAGAVALPGAAAPRVVLPGGAAPRRSARSYLPTFLALVAGLGILLLAIRLGSAAFSNMPKVPDITPPSLDGGRGGSASGAGFINLATSTSQPTATGTGTPTPTATGTATVTPTITPTSPITQTPTISQTPTLAETSTPADTPTTPPSRTPTARSVPPTSTPVPAPVPPTVDPNNIPVPSVVGMTEADAQQAIKNAGFSTAVPNYQTYTAQPVGYVLSQLPPAGTRAAKGTTVYIAVRK